jgi:hypothetical protein
LTLSGSSSAVYLRGDDNDEEKYIIFERSIFSKTNEIQRTTREVSFLKANRDHLTRDFSMKI